MAKPACFLAVERQSLMKALITLFWIFPLWGGVSILVAEDWLSVEKIRMSEGEAVEKVWPDLWSLRVLQGEFLIDATPKYVGAPDVQDFPSVGFDGTNYLVVWSDCRNGVDSDIYASRITRQGVVLDRAGIPISSAGGNQEMPSVAFDGTNYLVVWHDCRDGSDYDIYGARVRTDGAVLDPGGIPISTAPDHQEHPSVAFDATNYLVVWQDRRDGCDIYGARIDRDGTVLDPAGISISTATNFQLSPSIAFDGTNYLVVWHDYRSGVDIYGSRVSQAGVVLEPAGILISGAPDDQRDASVGFDGTNYLVVWHDYRTGTDWDIYGARVNLDGVVLDTSSIQVSAPGLERYPSVAFDGTNYLVVWQDKRNGDYDICGARVDRSGRVLDFGPLRVSGAANHQFRPSIAFDGTNYLAAWCDWRIGDDSDIYGTRISQDGIALDPAAIQLSISAYAQYSPSVAFDGANYLIVWEDGRKWPDPFKIYGARVDQSGIVLDPQGIEISGTASWQRGPCLAFDGTNYLTVWEDSHNGTDLDIYGARVDQSGVVIDTAGIPISAAEAPEECPSIAFDGTNYFVVWQDHRPGGWGSDIYGARVNRDGAVLDTSGIAILLAEGDQWDPSIAFNGVNYLVVWMGWHWPGDRGIIGARVDPSGVTLDSIVISTAANLQMYPSVASDGANYFVVWQDYRSGTDWDIYGARVSQEGIVLDPSGIPLGRAAYHQEAPSVIFSDTEYVVVWQDRRSGNDYDLYGARVSPSGLVSDSFFVCAQAGNQESPSVAKGAGRQHLVTYQGWAPDPWNAPRIWGKFSSFVGIEETANEQLSMTNVQLMQNVPNPFSKETQVAYSIWPMAETGEAISHSPLAISLRVYDLSGRLVKTLVDGTQGVGRHSLEWDGKDGSGRKVPPGIYMYRLAGGESRVTKKMVVLR